MRNGYLDALAQFAANTIRAIGGSRRPKTQKDAEQVDRAQKRDERLADRLRARFAASFARPNDTGNYPGKREPNRPFNGGVPLHPTQRFFDLACLFLISPFAREPQKQAGSQSRGRKFLFAGDRCIERVTAPTKSEARAKIKALLGIKTTRGIEVLPAAWPA